MLGYAIGEFYTVLRMEFHAVKLTVEDICVQTCPDRPLIALKIAPSGATMWTPFNTWFLWPTRVHIPNGIMIGSAVFAGLTIVTDRQTDRPTD